AEADRRRVIAQGVKPDVDDVRRVPRQGDAPRLSGAADRDVDQTALDQTEDLVAPDLRLQELRMRREMIEERPLVFGEPEKVVLLADPLRLQRRMQRTAAVDEVLLLLEFLAADAVPPLVNAFVDVARVVDAPRQFGDAGMVTRFGGADEVVERHLEPLPGAAEFLLHPIAV